MIKIKSLHKYFNRGKQNEIHVLNNITLDLPERGMVAIFGRSGCGKTTLLNVIGGLDSYLSGSVEIDGKRITTDSDAMRNRHIGYIFQNYNLNSSENCFDNVADALRLCGMNDRHDFDGIRDRTMAALSAVGMAQYASRSPDNLSGGQKQRIAIARAIVKSPDIILADEPTGNLDETNTVMIMDILREISKTRLVLLVTHEANLVDKYCDRVIGITDGRVTSARENDISAAYAVKNKNHIYLGEFEKSSAEAGGVDIDYYGEAAPEKVKLTVVNDGGRIFLRVDTPGVHIIDSYGETKLHEGVFEGNMQDEQKDRLDLSLLTPFEGKKYGRLFTFFASLKSGSRILSGKKLRRGKKVLKARNFFAASYLICFALIFTILIATCASGIAVFDQASKGTNPNTFYILTDGLDEAKLSQAVNSDDACVDFMNTTRYFYAVGQYISLNTGIFETFSFYSYDTYSATVPFLPIELISGSPVIAGSTDALGRNDVVLSEVAADEILKTATFGYISNYDELIGCEINGDRYYVPNGNSEAQRIAAIVRTGELAAYAGDSLLASYLNGNSDISVWRASDFGIKVNAGEAIIGSRTDADYVPKAGDVFKVNGVELKTAIVNEPGVGMDFRSWMTASGIPEASGGSYYENLEKDYSHLRDFAIHSFLSGFESSWLISYLIGGYEDALLIAADDAEYYCALKYREEHGTFPSKRISTEDYEKYISGYTEIANQCAKIHSAAYYDNEALYRPTAVFVSDEDYRAARFGYGETHDVALADIYYGKDPYMQTYLVLHSSDPEATESYLRSVFPDLPGNDLSENDNVFVTPELMIQMQIQDNMIVIIASAVALAIGLALMCICIYFLMRSSMLSKVRQIGIYRAIGVSKKNLIFKFAVESTAIALQTLVIGFAFGAYIASSLADSAISSGSFYFPFWLGAMTLALLVGTCILFGVIPIASLLRKTPAEILAKYDI